MVLGRGQAPALGRAPVARAGAAARRARARPRERRRRRRAPARRRALPSKHVLAFLSPRLLARMQVSAASWAASLANAHFVFT